ncbi:unnamed protein product [Cyclocybe aegerita]|uniref:Transmembrane protein n=1 Tax=Cyclocybe aegerita TaxID=1973307 RepID=A0A8S0W5V2_CYCAE|nr:unnamed protein product [Cyclocybe aegerita]
MGTGCDGGHKAKPASLLAALFPTRTIFPPSVVLCVCFFAQMAFLSSDVAFASFLLYLWESLVAIFTWIRVHVEVFGRSCPRYFYVHDLESGLVDEKREFYEELPQFPNTPTHLRGGAYEKRHPTIRFVQSHTPQTDPTFAPVSTQLECSEYFVDLGAVKTQHRWKLLLRGQRYIPRPSHQIKSKTHPTGNQLGTLAHPPEARGEDFRKWILVTQTLFPSRASQSRSSRLLRGFRRMRTSSHLLFSNSIYASHRAPPASSYSHLAASVSRRSPLA